MIRPQQNDARDYRGYAGTVASGIMKPGDEVMALPSGLTTTIGAIDTPDGPVKKAFPPMAVTVRLADEIDVSRGDMLCRPQNAPTPTQNVDALVCWMDQESPMVPGKKYAIKHTTRWARAVVKDLVYEVDVNTLHRNQESRRLELNQIGRVQLRVTQPLFVDSYRDNPETGSFILVDEATNRTVAAGMIGQLAHEV